MSSSFMSKTKYFSQKKIKEYVFVCVTIIKHGKMLTFQYALVPQRLFDNIQNLDRVWGFSGWTSWVLCLINVRVIEEHWNNAS